MPYENIREKQPSEKQPSKKQPSKKQPSKKRPSKKQPSEKQPRKEQPREKQRKAERPSEQRPRKEQRKAEQPSEQRPRKEQRKAERTREQRTSERQIKEETLRKEQSELALLRKLPEPLTDWFRANKRDLPWRRSPEPYHVWVSEIMLQQTRVEAVKPYYARFLQALPDVGALAEAKEETLLKLWEGLGYYNRVRNMQKAARQIMIDYQGEFPVAYEEIRGLAGIGSYTAGAISSFAYGAAKPAVDGNVLRVISRIMGSEEDIMRQSVRKRVEALLERVIPADAASDFNQGLIELGALICVPNGEPKCMLCPVRACCIAHETGRERELPVKRKAAPRRIERRTVLIFRDGETRGIRKRPDTGLLAGLYELPSLSGHLSPEEALAYSRSIGLAPLRIQPLGEAKHIFSHVEWHMTGYQIQVDELERSCGEEMIFARPEEIQKRYPIPAAFEKYLAYVI